MLDAILTMIGYYVIILTAAMVLIVVVVQIFKALSARTQRNERTELYEVRVERAGETSDELAAAVAAVSYLLDEEKPLGISAWSRVERTVFSPWKVASRSRRALFGGG